MHLSHSASLTAGFLFSVMAMYSMQILIGCSAYFSAEEFVFNNPIKKASFWLHAEKYFVRFWGDADILVNAWTEELYFQCFLLCIITNWFNSWWWDVLTLHYVLITPFIFWVAGGPTRLNPYLNAYWRFIRENLIAKKNFLITHVRREGEGNQESYPISLSSVPNITESQNITRCRTDKKKND